MADSDTQTVDLNDLDSFSDAFFGKPASAAVAPETNQIEKETSEIETPSATNDGNESQGDEPSGEESIQEDAPADEDEEVEVDEEKDSLFKVKPRKSAKERIDELTAARRDAERRADTLSRELEEFRRARQTQEQTQTKPAKTEIGSDGSPNPDEALEDGSPKYALGEFDPEYIRDLTRFTIQREHETIKKTEEEARTKQAMADAQRQLSEDWTSKLKESSEELPDLGSKAGELEHTFRDLDPNYGQYLAATIMSLDYGPHVLDYLADNIDEARKIVASGPTQATIALGRIEAKIAFGKETKRNEVEKGTVRTSAPPPPPRTRGSSTGNGVTGDTDDLDAFEKVFFSKKRR